MARIWPRRLSAHRSRSTPRSPNSPFAGTFAGSVVDELYHIDQLLRMVPDLAEAARLFDRSQAHPVGGQWPDALAEDLHEAFGRRLDAELDIAADLADLPYAATTVIETARWRLLRVAEAVRLASKGNHE
jgi:hypothetical protein